MKPLKNMIGTGVEKTVASFTIEPIEGIAAQTRNTSATMKTSPSSVAEDDSDGPIKSRKERRCTNKPMIYVFSAFLVILLGLTAYCFVKSDLRIIFSYYDHCGNFCGSITDPVDDPKFKCTGADHRDKKYVYTVHKYESNYTGSIFEWRQLYDELPDGSRVCVDSCDLFPNHTETFGACVPEKSVTEHRVLEELLYRFRTVFSKAYGAVIVSVGFSVGFSILLVLLLKSHPRVMVWGIVIAIPILLLGLACFFIVQYKFTARVGLLGAAAVCILIALVFLALMVCMRKRIALVIELIREAGKAIAKMPLLFLLPFCTLFISFFLYVCFVCILLLAISAGHLVYRTPNFMYVPDGLTIMTILLNCFALLWTQQFILGIQHMWIAGAVALWFFTRNKDEVKAPISKSLYNVICFHLGSILLGSLIIAIIQTIRAIVSMIVDELEDRESNKSAFLIILIKCCECCLEMIETFIAYINRNAYIEIAIFGFGFWQAGKRAFRVIMSNLLNVIAINSAGDMVLGLASLLVVFLNDLIVLTCFRSLLDDTTEVAILGVICFMVSLLLSMPFFSVYEMVIDTIFVCYCEDKEMNDGSPKKPYYMSANLKKFVEVTEEVLKDDPITRFRKRKRSSGENSDRNRA